MVLDLLSLSGGQFVNTQPVKRTPSVSLIAVILMVIVAMVR